MPRDPKQKKPKSSSQDLLTRFNATYQPRRRVSKISQLYHEKQKQQHCAIHCVNNILQNQFYTHDDFERLADDMQDQSGEAKKGWLSSVVTFFTGSVGSSAHSYKSPFGVGNYDANVLLNALCVKLPFKSLWFNRNKQDLRFCKPENYAGIVLNRPLSGGFTSTRHWVALVPFNVPIPPKKQETEPTQQQQQQPQQPSSPPQQLQKPNTDPQNQSQSTQQSEKQQPLPSSPTQTSQQDSDDEEIPPPEIEAVKEIWFNLDSLRDYPQQIPNIIQYLIDFDDRWDDAVIIFILKPGCDEEKDTFYQRSTPEIVQKMDFFDDSSDDSRTEGESETESKTVEAENAQTSNNLSTEPPLDESSQILQTREMLEKVENLPHNNENQADFNVMGDFNSNNTTETPPNSQKDTETQFINAPQLVEPLSEQSL